MSLIKALSLKDKFSQFLRKFSRFHNSKRLFIVHAGIGFVWKGFCGWSETFPHLILPALDKCQKILKVEGGDKDAAD